MLLSADDKKFFLVSQHLCWLHLSLRCDVAELPVARACVAAATLGNRLLVLGGKDTWGKEQSAVLTCDLTTHLTSSDVVKPMATPRHTFGAATAAGRVYAVGHGRLGDEADTVEFFDPGTM